ncbi:LysR family transcriptional regulator [Actinocatenispora sera]|uniref:LysR family transcriptional regulator n=1 Tax=Actinocatenispora sera TaxID=390989 RepID=A0A810L5X2_9ACTN|nr:LysR family transcriptional regulator [Actinocatenispora sera]BCJ30022.1 LysR family transcriptional regulator [Actinocatenispora sera]
MIDIRRVGVLRMIGQHGGVTAAAHALHLTPSAVSQQVKQLSRELGVPLLEPAGRGVVLTAAAGVLVRHADQLAADWERVVTEISQYADDPSGELRLCGFPTAIVSLLAPAAALLRARYPEMAVRVDEAELAEGYDLVLAGDADLAVVVPTPDAPAGVEDAKFDLARLLDEMQDLLLPADHPLAGRDNVELAEAADERWIVGNPARSHQQQLVLVACAAAGFTPDIAHTVTDWTAVAALVGRGLGVSLIPRMTHLPAQDAVARIPLRGTHAPRRRILTCVRRGSANQPAIERGLAALREVAGAGELHGRSATTVAN